MREDFYKLLLRSFDVTIHEDERRRLDNALAESDDLRAMQKEIVRLRSGLHATVRLSFKPFFAERVMGRLRDPQQSISEYFVSVFRSVAIGAAVLVIICTAYNVSRANAFTFESAIGIHQPTLEQALALEAPFE